MSNTIREYKPIQSVNLPGARDLRVTSTAQGAYGRAVQFTIEDQYIVLAQNQVEDLIRVLQKRLKNARGFSSTDDLEGRIEIKPKARKQ